MKKLFQAYPGLHGSLIMLLLLLNHNVRSQIIITVAGNGSGTYNGDNLPALQAQFLPAAIATDKAGNLFISDQDDSRIRKINLNGIISTFAGNGLSGFSGDGGPATAAKLSYPWGIAFDSSGNLLITNNGIARIRKVSNSGVINTIAGVDTFLTGGYNGDGILAINARLQHPACVALDTIGNIYISDALRIRKINIAGIITTIAGTGEAGHSGDGGLAINAKIDFPTGIITDRKGNIFFAESDSNFIRKIDKNGTITTIAGNGVAGYSGDGGSATLATLNSPVGLAIGSDGTLFIADAYNHAVRTIDTMGIIRTIVGDGSPGFNGDGGLAKDAKLNLPVALAFDNTNNLLIADYGNARIRKVISSPLPIVLSAFDAIYNNGKTEVYWQTSAEINTAYFNIQRSMDGINFITVGKVEAAGNSSTTKVYNFTDDGAIYLHADKLYYRLESTNKSGAKDYSRIIAITPAYTYAITLYPNPARDVLNAKVASSKKEIALIEITDLQGKAVKQLKVQLHVGYNNISINVATLAKGSYTMRLEHTRIQFIKL